MQLSGTVLTDGRSYRLDVRLTAEGRLLLLAVEGVRRKPLPPEKEAFITMVGFVLLIILAVVTFYNDLVRIVGG